MTYELEEYSTSLPPNEDNGEDLTANEQFAIKEFQSDYADLTETEDDIKYIKAGSILKNIEQNRKYIIEVYHDS